jgi:hypothetical protein
VLQITINILQDYLKQKLTKDLEINFTENNVIVCKTRGIKGKMLLNNYKSLWVRLANQGIALE